MTMPRNDGSTRPCTSKYRVGDTAARAVGGHHHDLRVAAERRDLAQVQIDRQTFFVLRDEMHRRIALRCTQHIAHRGRSADSR
jgi:hypothetical protein